jgi:hypothetical protein
VLPSRLQIAPDRSMAPKVRSVAVFDPSCSTTNIRCVWDRCVQQQNRSGAPSGGVSNSHYHGGGGRSHQHKYHRHSNGTNGGGGSRPQRTSRTASPSGSNGGGASSSSSSSTPAAPATSTLPHTTGGYYHRPMDKEREARLSFLNGPVSDNLHVSRIERKRAAVGWFSLTVRS